MNLKFLPLGKESKMLLEVEKYCRNDYALIRMTETMLKKSIIDASGIFRKVLKDYNFLDYSLIDQGGENKKIKKTLVFLENLVLETKSSFYRPKTKLGDPRFWIYNLSSVLKENDLIYLTIYDEKLVVIPLVDSLFNENLLEEYFGENKDDLIINELCEKFKVLKNSGCIESVSSEKSKSSPKDVGETLEQALGLKINNSPFADYKGEIEIKAKRITSKTNDTLFCQVPNWNMSVVKSSADVILKYGYPSKKYDEFIDLYVTVNNEPNAQGLFMGIDDDENVIFQNYIKGNDKQDVCKWSYDEVKKKLLEKHPKTAWILAEEKKIDGKIYFKYVSLQLTQNPIFTSFLNLITKGIVVYDWRGRVRKDKTGYKDKGHAFRISPKYRELLFGEIKTIDL